MVYLGTRCTFVSSRLGVDQLKSGVGQFSSKQENVYLFYVVLYMLLNSIVGAECVFVWALAQVWVFPPPVWQSPLEMLIPLLPVVVMLPPAVSAPGRRRHIGLMKSPPKLSSPHECLNMLVITFIRSHMTASICSCLLALNILSYHLP